MTVTINRIFSIIRSSSQNQILLITSIITLLGFGMTMTFIVMGIYLSNIAFLIMVLLTLLSFLFLLTILIIVIKVKLNWKLFPFIVLILLLVGTIGLCIDSVLTIIEFGWIRCELCP
jgi:hypothetical protein